jgi:hypothetical protein
MLRRPSLGNRITSPRWLASTPANGFCWWVISSSFMDSPFLVAIALIERDGGRAMPLGGRSCPSDNDADPSASPGETGLRLALELLLRLFQRSETETSRRAAGDDSLLLLEISLEEMTEHLPRIKAKWIAGGSTATLLQELGDLARRGWRLHQTRQEPLILQPWPSGSGAAEPAAPA